MLEPNETPHSETIVTPIADGGGRWDVRAHWFRVPIGNDALQTCFPETQRTGNDPLIAKIPRNGFAVVLPFGAVVFWQYAEPQFAAANLAARVGILQKLGRSPSVAEAPLESSEDLLVVTNQEQEAVRFRDVQLRMLTVEHLLIISEAVGKSAALKTSEGEISEALRQTTPLVDALRHRGELAASAKEIKKTVGFALSIRETVLVKLSFLDDPDATVRSERLARLHTDLFEHFQIQKRLSSLQEKVTFLSDLNLLLMELLQSRTSHRLEWIVIILIVIEVVLSVVHFFHTQ